MSTPPSRISPRAWLVCGVIAGFLALMVAGVLAFGAYWFSRQEARERAREIGSQQAAPRPTKKLSKLEQKLLPDASIEYRDGVAAAILIDTSGSMKETARDKDGVKRPKIEIARSAALEAVRQIESFAAAHPETTVRLGLYEFSTRKGSPAARAIVPIGAPDAARAEKALKSLKPKGDTPIGDAMIDAKRDLDRTGLARRHILVVTDGENTKGALPGDVTSAIGRLDDADRASIYVIAFDTEAAHFEAVKEAGGLVLSAASGRELGETLEYVLSGKILVEAPLGGR